MDDTMRILRSDLDAAIAYIPRLAGAIVLLLIGALFAWTVGTIVCGLLARLGLDRLAERTGLTEDLRRVAIRARPSQLLGRLTFAIVLIAVGTQAIDTLELKPISDALRTLLTFSPHAALAVLVLFFGVVLADFAARAVAATMARAGVSYHGPTATVLRGVIIALAALMALQQLTIESQFLLDVLLVILAGGALAGGIAVGWGSRSLAENVIASHHVERHLKVGDKIKAGEVSGTVDALGVSTTTLRTADGKRVLLPNASLAREIIEIDAKQIV